MKEEGEDEVLDPLLFSKMEVNGQTACEPWVNLVMVMVLMQVLLVVLDSLDPQAIGTS